MLASAGLLGYCFAPFQPLVFFWHWDLFGRGACFGLHELVLAFGTWFRALEDVLGLGPVVGFGTSS